MDFSYSEEQQMLRDLCAKIATEFGDEYWQKIDDETRFPQEFWDSLAENGILSATIPEEYGGGGTGLLELAIASEALGEFGAGNGAGGLIVNGPVFGGCLIARNGTKEQKEKYLPGLVAGDIWAGAFTEPNSGSNVTEITTRAELKDGKYIINGQKMFISNMKTAKHIAIFARTTKLDPKNKMAGTSILVGDLPDPNVEYSPFKKLGSHWMDTNAVFIDGMEIPENNIIGEPGKIFKAMFEDVLNPERIIIAASCIGVGLNCIKKAVEFGNERVIWGDKPISAYQGLQHPLAEAKIMLETARLKAYEAAWLYDQGSPKCGIASSIAKCAASNAAIFATEHSMQALGGSGYMCEYNIERHFRDVRLSRLAPVTHEMALNFIAQFDLGMPRSY